MDKAPLQLIVILGLSGSGKTTTIKALKDRGVFCIDNLPTTLIGQLIDGAQQPGSPLRHVALCLEVRSAADRDGLTTLFEELRQGQLAFELVYLFAALPTLTRRFQETRSTHPLADRYPLLDDAIAHEAALLDPLRPFATHEIDTSELTVHDLRRRIGEILPAEGHHTLHVGLVSFGFKHGLPHEADMVVDARFLPNPYFVPELKDHTGLEAPVARFVLDSADTTAFLTHLERLLDFLLPRYQHEGKAYFTLAIGCTGGHHRSVAIVEALAGYLQGRSIPLTTRHRDLER
ncbi:MAG: RNase adapter RapZ [Nitrospirae bacterium CG18_big_fil_WC_8_21_14_2_50_70_55]|nr:RNase adapter RapZ [Deltaproteobacteria bacterium]PIQ05506.1 MAG: RNase adapter RapZ [Nitrospirae bacterium CG18_big_fil_WC_8_21_14_2_50_70_55]PIU79979.1 MAG: RNase adapter RapZ [Nitrospirae bacterium CG06_land_8_20_14_3_00_70_43]PIW83993.1 MAG: RNase adapter RapZ [Nitrospirae bacterium CG_4_8_14_3_um_filter_70_85]PIX83504.1 MAG: RNase adapter RapZ [Nitrospirae bacterium CG_4_10_14_3_um_filter_70_108]PJB95335.1 MAG: RNase adapter RapZ [Nitrospirae bacterium CG_4_9_14_0_8_um_filter_70_14]HB